MKKIMQLMSPTFGEKFFGFYVTINFSLSFLLLMYLFIGTWQVVLFLFVAYFTVFLHELGHIYTAKYLGHKVNGVTMMFFGGVASIEKLDEDSVIPKHEFFIAIAGPAVNIVLFFIGAGLMMHFYDLDTIEKMLTAINSKDPKIVETVSAIDKYSLLMIETQGALVLFNLLPIFPMDGGRIFRSVLSMFFVKPLKAGFIVSWTAVSLSTLAFGYFCYTLNVNGMFVMPLIFILNYYKLKTYYKRLKIKNLPQNLLVCISHSFLREEEEIFYNFYDYNSDYISYDEIHNKELSTSLFGERVRFKNRNKIERLVKSFDYELEKEVLLLDSGSKKFYHYVRKPYENKN